MGHSASMYSKVVFFRFYIHLPVGKGKHKIKSFFVTQEQTFNLKDSHVAQESLKERHASWVLNLALL